MKGNIKVQETPGWYYTRSVAVDSLFGLQRRKEIKAAQTLLCEDWPASASRLKAGRFVLDIL